MGFVGLKKTLFHCVMGCESKIHGGKTPCQCDFHPCMGKNKTLSMPRFVRWLPSGSTIWHRSSVFPLKYRCSIFEPYVLAPAPAPQSWWAQISLLFLHLHFLSTHFLDVFLVQTCKSVVFAGFCWQNHCFRWSQSLFLPAKVDQQNGKLREINSEKKNKKNCVFAD